MSINVDYIPPVSKGKGTGLIKIGNAEYPTRRMFHLDIMGKSSPTLNENDESFIRDQRYLRALDCIKDGAINPSLSKDDVYSISYPDLIPRITFDTLHTIENKFMSAFSNKTHKHSWLKVNKESALDPKITTRTVFKESGLDPVRFIDTPKFCGNFANEVIDPAGRSPINTGAGDTLFPSDGKKLFLSQSFFEFFGFKNCFLEATRKAGAKYDFELYIDGARITSQISKGADFNISKPIDWFQGNREKNSFIRNLGSGHTDVKNGLLMAKEMGDVLQVLLMFIWTILNPGGSYSMVTIDKVVLLLCMVLGINCVLTNADGGSSKSAEGRVRSILFFEPSGDTPEKAKERFKKEKECIQTHNKEFIKCLHTLIKRPTQSIDIPGLGEVQYPKSFYMNLAKDAEKINDILKALPVISDPDQVDAGIRNMKENYTLNLIFRKLKSGSSIKMTMAKKYTEKDGWKSQYTPVISNSYGGQSFFEIAKREYIGRTEGGSKRTRSGSRSNSRSYDFSYLEFADGHFPGEKEAPYYVQTKEGENIDALAVFKSEVLDIMDKNHYSEKWNVHVFSALYHHFYIHEDVVYGSELESLIRSFMVDAENTVAKMKSTTQMKPSNKFSFSVDVNKLPTNVLNALKTRMSADQRARLERATRKQSFQNRRRSSVFTRNRRTRAVNDDEDM